MLGEQKEKEKKEQIEITKSFLSLSLPIGALRTFVSFIFDTL